MAELPLGYPIPETAVERWRCAVAPIMEQLEAVRLSGEDAFHDPAPHCDVPVEEPDDPTVLSCPLLDVTDYTVPFRDVATSLPAVMEKHGVAIVTGVAGEKECSLLEELWKADLEALGGVCPDYCAAGLPQGAFSWGCRFSERVKQAFQAIFGTSDLVVGTDALFYKESHPEQLVTTNLQWLHTDVNCYAPHGDQQCIQGILYVMGSEDPRSSTTVVCPGSKNDVYPKMMDDAYPREVLKHFVKVEHIRGHPELVAEVRQRARRVPVPRGALLLWDSRTVHQGWSAGKRLATPICWEPTSRRTEEALRSKWRCVTLGLPTSHWASLGIVHPKAPPAPAAPTLIPYPYLGTTDEWKDMAALLWSGKTVDNLAKHISPAVLRLL